MTCVWDFILAAASSCMGAVMVEYVVKPIAHWLFNRTKLPDLELLASEGIVLSKSSTAAFNKIMEALEDDKIKMIGVWGMAGVGKTTIVKKVGREAKGFDRVIFVTVSATPDYENIRNTIADFIDVPFRKKTGTMKASELCDELKKEKYLIILDDLWDEWNKRDDYAELNTIGIPLLKNGKGCKLILNTRHNTVCQKCEVTVSVNVLDCEEAWSLFKKKAELDESVPNDIVEKAKKVAKECKGLPIAIVTVARALKGTRSPERWDLACKKLESNRLLEIPGIEKGDKNAYFCIKTSYDYLEETARKFLFLCALFPEDHSINVEDLVRYAWGLELYGKINLVEDLRTQVSLTIDCLKGSSLLLEDGDEAGYRGIGRYVKLYDMVRDVALWITSKEGSEFMIKSRFPLLNNDLEPCDVIALLDGERNEFPEKSECSKLELMLLNNYDRQGLCFQGMQELKVLSLSIEKYSGRMISLHALQFLKKLRSLHLVNFKDFKFLGNLRTLEIFSLRGSEFEESSESRGLSDDEESSESKGFADDEERSEYEGLADDEITSKSVRLADGEKSSKSKKFADELRKLENLKILDLADCSFSNGFPADVIISLTKLEELYLRSMEGGSTAIFREINCLTTLSLAASSLEFPKDFWFPKLKRYDICINRSGYSVINGRVSRLQVERSLIVEKFDLNLVSRSLENIEFLRVLELEHECLINRRQKMLVPRILQNLKEVSIEKCENLKVVFQNAHENVEPLLSNLKLLNLHYLPKLSDIWELPIQHVRLEALVELKIWSCQSLKSIFSISLARSLVLLENLDISLCDELEQIVTESEGNEEEISSSIISPNSLCFPKLRKVNIAFCDGLEHIFPTLMAPQGVPQLEHLSVHYCRQLKQLVRCIEGRTGSDRVLQQLQFSKPLAKFSVVDCPLLRDSFVHLDVEVAHFQKVRLSAFKGSLFNGQKHLELKKIIEDHNLVPKVNKDGLNRLNSLRLEECKDVECLIDNTRGNGPTSVFTRLEILSIICLPGLETLCKGHVPKGFLRNLRELTVEKCFKLQVVFQMDDLPYRGKENQEKPFSNLQSLKLTYLDELRWIVKGPAAQSCSLKSLEVVKIENCGKLESLFSHSLIQSLVMLEELWISDCDGLKTLITELENNDGETESNTSFPTLFLPKLKRLYIIGCRGLQYALPITLAKGLPALAIVSVSDCDELKQVFGTVQGQNGVEQNVMVCLDNLLHLKLRFLRNLSSFAPQNYIFKVPVLEGLEVEECPRFMNFTISQVNNQLHLMRAGLSPISRLYNAKDLHLDGWEVLDSLVRAMQEVNGLCTDFLENNKKLIVTSFEQLREVFGNDEENQSPPLLSLLEHLKLESLSELRWIMKSVPTHSVCFRSLLVLEIDGCNQLKSLFPPSAVKTIRSLQQLKISNCKELKSVFTELESSDDEKIESGTLQLPNLKTVDISWCRNVEYVFPLALVGGLRCLQNISLFAADNLCSFFAEDNILEAPALENLRVSSCAKLRSFIVQKKAKKPVSLKKLNLEPHTRNTTNIPLEQMSPGWEYLTVGNFEQLFQLQSGNSISNLEDLSISHMIWLRDIWKGPIQSTKNLRVLSIGSCNGLTYIFPMMLAQNLPHLKSLGIRFCEKLKQIIGNEDSLASSSSSSSSSPPQPSSSSSQALPFEKRMEFPELERMSLWALPSLVTFSPLGYHLVFPSLKSFSVENCSKMITNFMMDYETLVVHAKTEQDASPLDRDIDWEIRTPFSLLPYEKRSKEL